MISTAAVYQRVSQVLKSGTSGYQSDTEFTNDMYSTFLDILNDLCDNYEKNLLITDLLNKEGLVVTTDINTSSSGTFPFPTGHYRTWPLTVKAGGINYPVTKIKTNEVGMYETSPIRKPDASKGLYAYYMTNGIVNMLPRTTLVVPFTHCVKPVMPILVLTVDSNDYEAVGVGTTDIKLPENLFNLFCYKMIERAGVEQKEQLAQSYAELGINREQV